MNKLYVVGIGPGSVENLTQKAKNALIESDVIVGYKPYLEYVDELIQGKETFTSGMRGEVERCKKAIEYAKSGKTTSIISTGDAGLYGMAGPIFELAIDEDIEIEVVPGVTSAFSAAAELGAPIMHDCALISLSDLMTSWELILKRVRLAAEGDFVMALYNPRSKGRPDHLDEALEIIRKYKSSDTPVGIVRDSGREGTNITITNLGELDVELVDMKTVVIIGNKASFIKNGKMITPRGYSI